MADRIYCYPNSDVLKNKIGIQDMEKLQRLERRLTMLRILELVDKPIQGKFDLQHLCLIHRYIFQDVYDWAGEIRKVDIAKGSMFCNVKFIESQAAEIFKSLKSEDYLQGLNEENTASRLAYYFSEINALHPFREGNGRSQREFIRTLALHIGYVINFAKVSKEEMLKASKDSFLCDYGKMEQLFKKCINQIR
ncbi:MAG: cell filamentation protein Fic [Lachnospiraceae bacterium]|nr:cell filamentation protein Fic [Lachnospiraceae bacterium]